LSESEQKLQDLENISKSSSEQLSTELKSIKVHLSWFFSYIIHVVSVIKHVYTLLFKSLSTSYFYLWNWNCFWTGPL